MNLTSSIACNVLTTSIFAGIVFMTFKKSKYITNHYWEWFAFSALLLNIHSWGMENTWKLLK